MRKRGLGAVRALWVFVVVGIAAAAARAGNEVWRGEVALGGQALEYFVTLERDDAGGYSAGTIDIPAQGVAGAALRDVAVDAESMRFALPITADEATWVKFSLARDGEDAASGTLLQGGMPIPTTLERVKRPQTPSGPFPYTVREVTFPSTEEGVTLAGTLTVPEGSGPFPALVLVTGSGAQDRDESLFHHKPFLVVADHLTRAGFAVLRYDDRGVGKSTGTFATSTTDDFAEDARGAHAFLAAQPEVDALRVGILGHSEGAIVAPMVAADNDKVAFIIMLAGSGVPGREVLLEQGAALFAADGAAEEAVAAMRAAHGQLLDLLTAAEPDDAATLAALKNLIAAQARAAGQAITNEQLDAQVTMAQVEQLRSPWMKRFLALDPKEYLARVKCPVLVLNGALDLQILPEQNVGEINAALITGGNDDVTIYILDGLNHLFQPAVKGTVAEYGEIETTIDPLALKRIREWLQVEFGAARAAE